MAIIREPSVECSASRLRILLHDAELLNFANISPQIRGSVDPFKFVRGRKSRRDRWVVLQFTMKSRLARSCKAVWEWCRLCRHPSLRDQQRYLSRVIRGHCNDHGLTSNGKQLGRSCRAAMEAGRQWLGRGTSKVIIPWARFNQILVRYPLPAAKVVRTIYAA